MDRFLDRFRNLNTPPGLTIYEDPETGTIHVGFLDDPDDDDLDEFSLFMEADDAASVEPDIDAHWFAPGEHITVGDFTIDAGYIYVGQSLRPSRFDEDDPSLISPDFPISNKTTQPTLQPLGYWPAYASLTPTQRAVYLGWLAGGRQDPDIDPGYAFIFFYGLELFLFANPTSDPRKAELLPGIREEIGRLLDLYGDRQSSFSYYASALIKAFDLVLMPTTTFAPPEPPALSPAPTWDIPQNLPLTIGQFVKNGQPIPPEWALAWTWYSPDVQLRTPAFRCRDEFARLFTRRYMEQFGDGMKVRAGKGRIRVHYVPANRALDFRINTETSIPNVFEQRGPVKKLVILAEDVQIELDSYSRWLARNEDKRGTFAALGYLPADLVDHDAPLAREFTDWATSRIKGDTPTLIPGADLIARWREGDAGKLTPAEADSCLNITAELGFGIEPDLRFGGKKLTAEMTTVIFRLSGKESMFSRGACQEATTLAHLAMAVAAADGQVTRREASHLATSIAANFDLPQTGRERLAAHLLWLSTTKITLGGMKSRINYLTEEERGTYGDILVAIATAGGTVSPAVVTTLTKIFRMLGLDTDSVTSRLHLAMTGGTVTRRAASTGTPGVSALDTSEIDRIQADTGVVSALLNDIFADEDPAIPEVEPTASAPNGRVIEGLDAPHTRLLDALGQRAEWPRDEYDALAAQLAVMPGGAIDVINDAAFDIIGDPVIEGDDPLTINLELIQDLYT